MKIKLKQDTAQQAAQWLNKRQWKYDLNIEFHNPFNGKVVFEIPCDEHAMMFKLTWLGR